MPVGLGDEWT